MLEILKKFENNLENQNIINSVVKDTDLKLFNLFSKEDLEILNGIFDKSKDIDEHKDLCQKAFEYIEKKDIINKTFWLIYLLDYEEQDEVQARDNITQIILMPNKETLRALRKSNKRKYGFSYSNPDKQEIYKCLIRFSNSAVKYLNK